MIELRWLRVETGQPPASAVPRRTPGGTEWLVLQFREGEKVKRVNVYTGEACKIVEWDDWQNVPVVEGE